MNSEYFLMKATSFQKCFKMFDEHLLRLVCLSEEEHVRKSEMLIKKCSANKNDSLLIYFALFNLCYI